jgi:hypothetical protein
VSQPPVLNYTQCPKPVPPAVQAVASFLKLLLVVGSTVAVVLIMTITFVFLFRVFELVF